MAVFLGHFAVGFAAKRVAPKASIGTLLAAAQLLDLLWPVLLLLGVEHVRIVPGAAPFAVLDFTDYPLSHSLLLTLIWAGLFAVLYRVRTGYTTGAVWVWICVVSHWVLDFASHRPDLPLWPGGPRLGLGLWNSPPATLAVEIAMFAGALWSYFALTRARDAIGRWALLALLLFLIFAYCGSVTGPPPPNLRVLALTGMVGWLLVPWIYWIDRHRELR